MMYVEVFYMLFIACCLFGISLSGLVIAASMWKRSKNNCICEACKKESDK